MWTIDRSQRVEGKKNIDLSSTIYGIWFIDKTVTIFYVMLIYQCGKPFFSNTRQNGEWTETSTRQNETELAMIGE
jgi:hypothetical protein